MGNLLVAPITEKETHRGVTEDGMEYAVSSMQGWRVHMEDAHITEGILYAEEPILQGGQTSSDSKHGITTCNDNGGVGIGMNSMCNGESSHHLSKRAKTMENAETEAEAEAEASNNGDDKHDQEEESKLPPLSSPNSDTMASSPANSTTATSSPKQFPSSPSSNSNSVIKYNRIKLEGHSLFSVFDGHGGSFAAEYAGLNYTRVLSRQPAFVQYAHFIKDLATRDAIHDTVSSSSSSGSGNSSDEKKLSPQEKAQILRQGLELLEKALRDAFLDLDREIWREVQGYRNRDGILPKNKNAGNEKNNAPYEEGNDNGDGSGAGGANNQDLADNNDGQEDEAMHNPDPADEEEWHQKQDSGTTAVAVLFTPQWIICSNAGDSRSVYSKQGNCTIPLSYDHKPDDEAEERRIYDAGGFVRGNRVEGDLAVSRGLGDFRFKEDDLYRAMGVGPVSFSRYSDAASGRKKRGQMGAVNVGVGGNNPLVVSSPADQKVSPMPDIIVQNRDLENDEFVVVACDGIFDVQSNHECVALTADIMRGGEGDLGLVCEEILDECLEKGSKDNMTALVIKMPAQTIGEGGGVAERRRIRREAAEQAHS